jgi:hypothetical protein
LVVGECENYPDRILSSTDTDTITTNDYKVTEIGEKSKISLPSVFMVFFYL